VTGKNVAGSTLIHDANDVEMEEVVAQTRNALNSIKDTLAQVNCTVYYSHFMIVLISLYGM
jgi:hypothetical protein